MNTLKPNSAYEIVEQMDPDYVRNRKLRMMFLQANGYNAAVASHKIISFSNIKHNLFGRERFAKDITLDDMNEDDLETLHSGFFQFLLSPDLGGRRIMSPFPSMLRAKTMENELQARFYLTMAVLGASEEVQKMRVVSVAYTVGSPPHIVI